MCQLDGAMGCQDTWSDIILGVSLFEWDSRLNWWTEESRLSSLRWVGLVPSVEGPNKTRRQTLSRVRQNSFGLMVS